MAGSRLEKIGTIFSRTTALFRKGVMKPEDKPIWYDIYAIHPPEREPRYDREPPSAKVREIFYEEDVIRAKFHKARRVAAYNFADIRFKTQTQEFIDIYTKLKEQGPLDDEKIFETALDILYNKQASPTVEREDEFDEQPISLVSEFKRTTAKTDNDKKGISISDIMKD